MVERLRPVALVLGLALGASLGSVACNALTGAGDLEARDCPECDGGRPDDVLAEGGSADARADGQAGGDASDNGRPPTVAGGLDTTFGTGGLVVSALLDDATAVAVRSDGMIYVGGSFGGHLAVARFDASGAPDTTFGSGGRVTVPTLTNSSAQGIAIDSLGRVIAAGYAKSVDVAAGTTQTFAYIVRIGATAVDTSFANQGRRVFTIDGETLTSVIVTSASGDLVVAGSAPGTPVVGALWVLSASGAFVVPRSDITYVSGDNASVSAMTAAVGEVSLAGNTNGAGGDHFGISRFKPTGFDSSFDGDGRVVASVGPGFDSATAIARLSDGSLVVGGETQVVSGSTPRSPQFGLVRLQKNGAVETSFASSGKLTLSFEQPGTSFTQAADRLRAMISDSKDRIVAVGYSDEKTIGPFQHRVVMTRIMSDGKLDPLFATGGKLTFQFGGNGGSSRAVAVAAQPDGKLVVVGPASAGVGIARVTP